MTLAEATRRGERLLCRRCAALDHDLGDTDRQAR
jgi:hypothetical protein